MDEVSLVEAADPPPAPADVAAVAGGEAAAGEVAAAGGEVAAAEPEVEAEVEAEPEAEPEQEQEPESPLVQQVQLAPFASYWVLVLFWLNDHDTHQQQL